MNKVERPWLPSQCSQPGRALRPVRLAVQTHLDQRLAHGDAAAREKRRLQFASQIGFVETSQPPALLGLGFPISRRDRIERIRQFLLFFNRKRQPLAQTSPKSMCDQYVMQEGPKLPIAGSQLMPLDRPYFAPIRDASAYA